MKKLTKEMLIQYGVSSVSEDGKIMVNGHYAKESLIGTKHKYGKDCYYPSIGLSLRDEPKVKYKDGKMRYPRRRFTVARVMLAWFNGSIDANMDADHIDGNKYNNHLSNLQAITRKENLEKRALTQKEIIRRYHLIKKELEKNPPATAEEIIKKYYN